jgi:hypothetical protein
MLEGIKLGLSQGGIVSVVIVSILALLAFLLVTAILRLGAALVRIGFILMLILLFLFALTRLFNA